MASGMPAQPSQSNVENTDISQPCEGVACAATDNVPRWLCIPCSSTYCDICWEKQGPHKPGKVSMDKRVHEKIDKKVYDHFNFIFNPPVDPEKDRDNRSLSFWLGAKSVDGQPTACRMTRRYQDLLGERSGHSVKQYPILVSYLGYSGSGISTIATLIRSLDSKYLATEPSAARQPVEYDDLSGVQLHLDASTASSHNPLLHADCKGLLITEIDRAAVQLQPSSSSNNGSPSPEPKDSTTVSYKTSSRFGDLPRKKVVPSHWRRSISAPKPTPPPCTPSWAMANVYRRLIYNVSDVVVFVVREQKASKTINLILDTASTSLDFSVDQALRPRAILVLNATDPEAKSDEWHPDKTTKRFLEVMDTLMHETFITEHIRKLGMARPINTFDDLIKRYYTSFRIVRIPEQSALMLCKQQIGHLDDEIFKAWQASFKLRSQLGEKMDVDEFHTYISSAGFHFVKTPDKPLLRIPVSYLTTPVPSDFQHHILSLARDIAGQVTSSGQYISDHGVFNKIGPLIASYIRTYCVNRGRFGILENIFDRVFAPICTAALRMYVNNHLPCNFSANSRRCIFRKADHGPYHAALDGSTVSTIGAGVFHSGPFPSGPEWCAYIKEELNEFRKKESAFLSQNSNIPIEKITGRIHLDNLRSFFGSFSICPVSRFTCFTCLMEIPQHRISCGHFLCTPCVQKYGICNGTSIAFVRTCPLDGKELDVSEKYQFRLDSVTKSEMESQKRLSAGHGINRQSSPSTPAMEKFGGGPGGMSA